jgi:hypothetical protein
MPDVENLFSDYIAEHRAGGEADPRAYLAQVEPDERKELAALIEAYLDRAPGREWDATAFAGSAAERTADQLAAEWAVGEGAEAELQGWRDLLPALRNRARLMRRDLVARLAEGLGHPGETPRVAEYYHQMETGQLPADGVSDRVLGVLGEILGESAERLRAAGRAAAGSATDLSMEESIAFTRVQLQHSEFGGGMASPADVGLDALAEEKLMDPEPSEIDRLFTGGPAAG